MPLFIMLVLLGIAYASSCYADEWSDQGDPFSVMLPFCRLLPTGHLASETFDVDMNPEVVAGQSRKVVGMTLGDGGHSLLPTFVRSFRETLAAFRGQARQTTLPLCSAAIAESSRESNSRSTSSVC